MIQEKFNVTVDLIRRKDENFSFLERLLNAYDSTVLVFSFFNKPARGNARQHILTTYELKAKYSHLFMNGELLSRERE